MADSMADLADCHTPSIEVLHESTQSGLAESAAKLACVPNHNRLCVTRLREGQA